jgi:hypothetical protein
MKSGGVINVQAALTLYNIRSKRPRLMPDDYILTGIVFRASAVCPMRLRLWEKVQAAY